MRTILITHENISEYKMFLVPGTDHCGQAISIPVIMLEKNLTVAIPADILQWALAHKSFFWVIERGENRARTLRSSAHRYTIYRDDDRYPVGGNTIEEIRRARSEGNFRFMSHGYGSEAYDVVLDQEINIYA